MEVKEPFYYNLKFPKGDLSPIPSIVSEAESSCTSVASEGFPFIEGIANLPRNSNVLQQDTSKLHNYLIQQQQAVEVKPLENKYRPFAKLLEKAPLENKEFMAFCAFKTWKNCSKKHLSVKFDQFALHKSTDRQNGVLELSFHSMCKLRAALKGWKTRKIFKSRKIKEYLAIIRDVENMLKNIDNPLRNHLFQSLMKAKQSCRRAFSQYYNNGRWVSYYRIGESADNNDIINPRRLRGNYFFRESDNHGGFNGMYNSDIMPKQKKFEFLRRKSVSVKGKKVKWRSKSKVDCWVRRSLNFDRSSTPDSLRKKPRKYNSFSKPIMNHLDFSVVISLEGIFQQMFKTHETAAMFFQRRNNFESRVPLISENSKLYKDFNNAYFHQRASRLETDYFYLSNYKIY